MRRTTRCRFIVFIFSLLSLFNTGYSQVNLTNGLVAYYPFNGNANDASGNGNNGATTNVTLTTDRGGAANSAYYFNGTNASVLLPYSALYNFSPSGAHSISVWVQPDVNPNWTAQAVVVKSPPNPNYLQSQWNYGTYLVNRKAMAGYGDNHVVTGTTVLNTNQCWYNITYTYDNGRWHLYVNGVLEATDVTQTKFILQDGSASRIAFGKKGESSGDYYRGKMDEVRIYNRVLTQQEIAALSQQDAQCMEDCNSWLHLPTQPSWVNIGDLDIPGDKLTIEAQINIKGVPPPNGVIDGLDIVSKHTGPGNANYLFRSTHAELTTTNGFFVTPFPCMIEMHKTYHVAIVYDGATLKYYRNGFLMSSIPATGNMVQNDFPTGIGYISTLNQAENFIGYINEVRIWNVARTQEQLRTYMNSTLPAPTTQAGLLAYYTFNSLVNKQGNPAWNGTLVGAAAINRTNPECVFVEDSCEMIPPPDVMADFDIPATVCADEPVAITNLSENATNYYWNFCGISPGAIPTATNLGNPGGMLSAPVFSDIVEDNGNYYLFVINNGPGGLIRLDFGNSLLNTPVAVNLSNVGGTIPNGAEGIQIVNNNGNWYALIVGGNPAAGVPSRIVKIDFGANITNVTPAGTNWGNIGNMAYPHDLYVFRENGIWYGYTASSQNNRIIKFNFGSNFSTVPTATNLGNVGSLNTPVGLGVIKGASGWYMFVTNGNSTITRLRFGSTLLNIPTGTNIGNPGNSLSNCRDIAFMQLCNTIEAFVVNGGNNTLTRLSFGSDLMTNTASANLGNIGAFSLPHSISDIFLAGDGLYAFSTNANDNSLTRINFAGCTGMPGSTLQNPPAVSYSQPGTYTINLLVDIGLPTQMSVCKQIVVQGCDDTVIINRYTEALAFDGCKNILKVADASEFHIGDTVLLIQMKGAVIDSTNTPSFGNITDYRNAGNYEFNYIKAKDGNNLELLNVVQRQYDFEDGKVQLIRVPYFEDYTVTNTLTCLPWDGSKGGVLVFNVQNTLTLEKNLDVSGRGFRGGASANTNNVNWACNSAGYFYPWGSSQGAAKGEGIASISQLKSNGKGALANGGGGGNQANAGGGGGGNAGAGGLGGNQFEFCTAGVDGRGTGGKLVNQSIQNKIFLGGGGGAGDANNPPPNSFASFGGNGGGIIIVSASQLVASSQNKILANGDAGLDCNTGNCHEGMGGGGAGGSILLDIGNYTASAGLTLEANGGKGADAVHTVAASEYRHGVGGGGAGGLVGISAASLPPGIAINYAGGLSGVNTNFANNPWGATKGGDGTTVFNLQLPVANVPFKPNIDSVRINKTPVSCKAFDFEGLGYTNTYPVASWYWDFGDNTSASTQNTSHTYPASGSYNVKLVITDINGCKDSILTTAEAVNLEHDFIIQPDVCSPYFVQITGTGAGIGTSTCEINPGDGTPLISGICDPVHQYAGPGDYTVHYILSSGICRDTVTKIIAVGFSKDDIIITPDTTICYGDSRQLRTVTSLDFCWTPITYLDDPLSPNPFTSTPEDITYYFNARVTGNNLIANGDFSQGNTGFTSAYVSANPNTTEGQYFVGTNPQSWNGGLSVCGDHTAGNGNMMLVNGSPVPDQPVWEQNVTVLPNTNYAFSTWIQALGVPNPARLQFSINGATVGNLITASLPPCSWQQFYTTWNSGTNTSVVISIVNKNTELAGNDFALDDISFAPVFIRQDSVVITVDRPFVQTNNDTIVCIGSPVQLNTAGALTYSWTPVAGLSDAGIANPVANPLASTEYIVTGVNNNGCAAKDTVYVNTFPKAPVSVTNDTLICKNSSVQLSASGGVGYSWTPPVTLNDPLVADPVATPGADTKYYVTITDVNECDYADSVLVSFRPDPVFAVNAPAGACLNDSVQLTASGGDLYNWQPALGLSDAGLPDPKASPAVTTDYTVTITETVCNQSDVLSTRITVFPLPVIQASKSNDIDCSNDQSQLNAMGGISYAWSPSFNLSNSTIANPVARPVITTEYVVEGTDARNCSNYDTVIVSVDNTNKGEYLMPDAFTPNGDGLNDCFGIRYWGVIQELQFSIYNRWGERVFYTTDPAKCWDGTYKGVKQGSDVFVYWIRAKTSCEDYVFRKGTFVLIR